MMPGRILPVILAILNNAGCHRTRIDPVCEIISEHLELTRSSSTGKRRDFRNRLVRIRTGIPVNITRQREVEMQTATVRRAVSMEVLTVFLQLSTACRRGVVVQNRHRPSPCCDTHQQAHDLMKDTALD